MHKKVVPFSALVSISEAARLLGVSISTLRNWEKQGYIHPFRIVPRAHRRYELADLLLMRQKGSRAYRPLGRTEEWT